MCSGRSSFLSNTEFPLSQRSVNVLSANTSAEKQRFTPEKPTIATSNIGRTTESLFMFLILKSEKIVLEQLSSPKQNVNICATVKLWCRAEPFANPTQRLRGNHPRIDCVLAILRWPASSNRRVP